MKLFALETNPQRITDKYTVAGEDQLLLTRYHPIIFWGRLITSLIIFSGLSGVFVWADRNAFMPEEILAIVLVIFFVFSIYYILQSFIGYHYSFIMVTTAKVVCVRHIMFWKQEVDPTNIGNIISTRQVSQFLGIFDCGVVNLSLLERTDYSTKTLKLKYVPNPNKVAGFIENAIALHKQGVKKKV